MTLGERLIDEITARGRRGRYFDLQGYQTLRGVETPERLRAFLDARGFGRVTISADLADVARQLALVEPGFLDVPLVTFGVGMGLSILAFGFALLLGPITADSFPAAFALLVSNLTILVPLMLGFWYGLVQQSLRAMFWGIAVGAVVGGMERFLGRHSLDILGLFLLCPLMTFALAPEGRPWCHEATARFLRGLLLALGLLLMGGLGIALTSGAWISAIPSMAPRGPLGQVTPAQSCLAILLHVLLFSPWAGMALLWFHCATGLPHPLRGPCLTLFSTKRFQPVQARLKHVAGNPHEVYKILSRRIRQEDAAFRRRYRWYGWSLLASILVVLAAAFLIIWITRVYLGTPPYWAAVARGLLTASIGFVFPLLQQIHTAAQQQSLYARVAQELDKYPEGTTLEAIKAGTVVKNDE